MSLEEPKLIPESAITDPEMAEEIAYSGKPFRDSADLAKQDLDNREQHGVVSAGMEAALKDSMRMNTWLADNVELATEIRLQLNTMDPETMRVEREKYQAIQTTAKAEIDSLEKIRSQVDEEHREGFALQLKEATTRYLEAGLHVQLIAEAIEERK
jgi:ferredoxin-NADP reductase